MTKGDQRPRTLRELLIDCGNNILDNPFLQQIVEAAPSPTAADRHIQNLGWSTKTARAVRNAVRLKKQYPDQWPLMKKTSLRPIDTMCSLSSQSPDHILGEGILIQQKSLMGEQAIPCQRPLLLRELEIKNSKPRANTFDMKGNQSSFPIDTPSNWFLHEEKRQYKQYYKYEDPPVILGVYNVGTNQWELSIGYQQSRKKGLWGGCHEITIHPLPACLMRGENFSEMTPEITNLIFPRLCKRVLISQTMLGEKYHKQDSIRLLIFTDLGNINEDHTIGFMSFDRRIEIPNSPNNVSRVAGKIFYRIHLEKEQWLASMITSSIPSMVPGISITEHPDVSPYSVKVPTPIVLNDLGDVLAKFLLKKEVKLDLEQIAGLPLLQSNSKKNLLSFVIDS